jgi:hypothetical protein
VETTLKFELEFVDLIKQKPELKALDDAFVNSYLKKIYLSLGSFDLEKYSSFKQCLRSKKTKELISTTRKDLRTVFGLFVVNPLNKKIINSLQSFDDDQIDDILSSHRSTEERLPFYSSIYPLIFDKLKTLGLQADYSLLDIACGYNPFAYKFLPFKPQKYLACDLSSSEMSLVNDFFSQTKISGSAFGADAISEQFFLWLETNSFDLCFLFKALDSFEQVQRHISKKLLSMIKSKFFVVSFSLVSIGGNSQIQANKRTWFERFCERNGWQFETVQVPNEIYYVIKA